MQKLEDGSVPRSIMVVLQDDLVDSCIAGDDVVVTGIVRRMWLPVQKEERCDLELFLQANHVAVNNDSKAAVQVRCLFNCLRSISGCFGWIS